MNDAWIGVIATLIGAALGLSGSWLASSMQLRAAREQWERSRVDARREALLAEVRAFAGHASAITNEMAWIAWMATDTPGDVQPHHFDDYDKLAKLTMQQLMASLAVIALLDADVHDRLTDVQFGIHGADAALAQAGQLFRSNNPDWPSPLRDTRSEASAIYQNISATLVGVATI